MNVNIEIISTEEKTTLVLSGRLDTVTAPKFQEALMPQFENEKHIELDFAKLVYVSSAGLRVLLMGEKTAKAKGSKQTLVNVLPDVMEVFEMTGFSDVLHFE